MVTRIAWLLNLDAERELADPQRYRPLPKARIAPLAARMSLLLAPDDHVLDPGEGAHGCGLCQRALAFCPTPSALQQIARAGFVPPPAPSLELLARVNSRAFCAGLGQTLAGARYVRNMDELLELVSAPRLGGWLLKRDFAFAGRERRRAFGAALDASTLGFAQKSFARGQGLQVEPWLVRSDDFAQHGYLSPEGELSLGPALRQRCDQRGSWQSSAPIEPGQLREAEQAALEASVRSAGRALSDAGYFGPFGVDAFRFADPERGHGFQPRSEINARFSMGYPRALLERGLGDNARGRS